MQSGAWRGSLRNPERNILQSFKLCFLNLPVGGNSPKEHNFLRSAACLRMTRKYKVAVKRAFWLMSEPTPRDCSRETVLQLNVQMSASTQDTNFYTSPAFWTASKQPNIQVFKDPNTPKHSITELILVICPFKAGIAKKARSSLADFLAGRSRRP